MANMSLEKIKMPEQAPDVRNKNFKEVSLGYTEEMAIEEAQRCLNCKHKPCVSVPLMYASPNLSQRLQRVTSWRLIRSSPLPMRCLRSAVVFVRRKASANPNVSEA